MSAKFDRFTKEIMTQEEYQIVMQGSKLKTAREIYTDSYIDSVTVYKKGDKRFVLQNKDKSRLPKHFENTLEKLSKKRELINPVYVEIDANGALLIEL
jgi:hypothetical protein